MPMNSFGYFYEDDLKVECPKGSGNYSNLIDVGQYITNKLLYIFEANDQNERPVFGPYKWFYKREENQHLILFHEYFHGDNARGLGASHQTGWTGLIANLINELKEEKKGKVQNNDVV